MSNNNFALDEEIELKEILQIISKSKKLVVFIIIFCTLLAAGYANFLKPTTYFGHAKIVIGEFNDIPLINLKENEQNMRFIYGESFGYTQHNDKYLELKVESKSRKSVNSEITTLTQFIIDTSEEAFNRNSAKINNQLKIIENRSSIIDEKFKSAEKELNNSDYDSEFLFQLKMKKNDIESEYLTLKNREMDLLTTLDSGSSSALYEPISIIANDKKEHIYIFFGFLFGIVFSIILILIRSNFDKNN